MNKLRILAALALSAALMMAPCAFAQNMNSGSNPQLQPQAPGSGMNQPGSQGEENDSTLELAPQPGTQQPKVEELPGARTYRPDSDTSSINRNFNPDTENGDSTGLKRHGRPYLGIEVQYTTECIGGSEEYGLKVTKVDAHSPASVAGLQSGHEMSAAGAAAMTLGGIIPLVSPLVGHFAEKSGSLGNDGDLIVAVDDERIRSQADLDDKIAQLKPGDTLYLTVLRPIGGGQHKTLKIAVKVGEWGQPVASNDSAPSTPPQ